MHAGRQIDAFQRGLHRQRIHDRRQHAHIVGSGALDTRRRPGESAEYVAAANNQTDLGAELHRLLHIGGNSLQRSRTSMP